VQYLQNVFLAQTSWGNVDRPSVSFKGDASPDIFEEFAKEPEKYPCILVGNRGSVPSAAAIDGYISQEAYSQTWGDYPTFVTTIGDGAKVAIKATPTATATWHTVKSTLKWDSGNDYVVVSVLSGSNLATATTITSGSIKPFDGTDVVTKMASFTSATAVNKGANVWLTFGTDGAGTYRLCGDASKLSGSAGAAQYVRATQSSGSSAWQVTSGSTYCCAVSDRTYDRRGGTRETSIEVAVLAKDQVAADQLADLCCVYIDLARQSRLTRLSDLGISNSLLVDHIGEFLKTGVAVMKATKGNTTTTKRGQDNLYKIPVTVTLFSTWYEDFAQDYLEDVTPTVTIHTG
jgi:hypothetical protein